MEIALRRKLTWLGGWCEWCQRQAVLRGETLCEGCQERWGWAVANLAEDVRAARMWVLRKMAGVKRS